MFSIVKSALPALLISTLVWPTGPKVSFTLCIVSDAVTSEVNASPSCFLKKIRGNFLRFDPDPYPLFFDGRIPIRGFLVGWMGNLKPDPRPYRFEGGGSLENVKK